MKWISHVKPVICMSLNYDIIRYYINNKSLGFLI